MLEEYSSSELVSKTSKKIQKRLFTPIIEDGICYRYDDNPAEYKRIRKKIMNRESATRVREREKITKIVQYSELEELRKINADLMIQNASLNAENSMLRQQLVFLEKLALKSKNERESTVVDISEKSTCSFDFPSKRHKEEIESFNGSNFLGSDGLDLHDQLLPEEEGASFYRINSPLTQSGNFHFSLLTIFTIFLSVFAWQLESGKPDLPFGQFSSGNLSPKSIDDIDILRNNLKNYYSMAKNYQFQYDKLYHIFLVFAFVYFIYILYLGINLFWLKKRKIKII